jgi:hypothetical protein
VHQWNAVIQRQFGNDWVASATYTGSESAHLLSSYQANPVIPGTGGKRLFTVKNYPGAKYYADIDILDSSGTSSYNGLILAIQKRLSKGLSTSANYTWSHCVGDLTIGNSTGNAGGGYQIIDTTSGVGLPGNRRYDRSNCQSIEIGGTFSSDRRQIFNWTTVYETPKFSNKTTNLLGSGWKISGIYRAMSAPWLTVGLSSENSGTGVFNAPANLRPNYAGGNTLCDNPSPSCWINPSAFALPAAGTFGNLGRDIVRGPMFWQLDMSLARQFRIREGKNFELRGDVFNLTNSLRAGISPPSLQAGASGLNLTFNPTALGTFGRITSALDPRIIQLSGKFVF